jgi:thiol-disulfide isomerase/thioredoxin
MRRRFVLGPLLTVILVAVGCSGSKAISIGGSNATGAAIVATGAKSVSELPKDRFALPTFNFRQFETLLHDLSARHIPAVVNIWASWCGPCKIESPNLKKAAEQYGGEVQFIGVDILDQRGQAQQFIREEGYPYPSVFDPTGEIRSGLGYIGQPVTIFYDSSGRRAFQWVGPIGLPQLGSGIRMITSS